MTTTAENIVEVHIIENSVLRLKVNGTTTHRAGKTTTGQWELRIMGTANAPAFVDNEEMAASWISMLAIAASL